VAARGACPDGSSRTRAAAVDIFDAMYDASSAMGSPNPRAPSKNGISISNTTAALASGVRGRQQHSRLSNVLMIVGGAHELLGHQRNAVYWTEFGTAMDEIGRHPGLHMIPSIGYSHWWWTANQAFAGVNETQNDFILNASSVRRPWTGQQVLRADCHALRQTRLRAPVGVGQRSEPASQSAATQMRRPHGQCFGITAMTKFTAEVVGIISHQGHRPPPADLVWRGHPPAPLCLVPGITRAVTGSQTRVLPV
jgi:hypothetical protein